MNERSFMLNTSEELLKIYLTEKFGHDSPQLKESIEFYMRSVMKGKEDETYLQISEATSHEYIGEKIRIRVMITSRTQVKSYPVIVNGKDNWVDGCEIIFRDEKGDEIRSLLTPKALIPKAVTVYYDLICIVALVPEEGEQGYVYEVIPLRLIPVVKRSHMLKTQKGEAEDVVKIIRRELKLHGTVVPFIKNRLIEIYDIKGLDDQPVFDLALEAVIYQAASGGYIDAIGTSANSSILIIGAPGNGKKFITKTPADLNPVHTEVSAYKSSIAGICGATRRKDGMWISDPGALSQSHGGSCSIQDYHNSPPTKKREICAAFSQAMEDAYVIDSCAANKKHPAHTRIIVDMNIASDIYFSGLGDSSVPPTPKELGISTALLSRFDTIFFIPRDNEIQQKVTLEMFGRDISIKPEEESEPGARIRNLQLVIALLSDAHTEIEMPLSVRKYAESRFSELYEANVEQLGRLEMLSDFQRRMVQSVFKLMAA
jgi:hypothetical protein